MELALVKPLVDARPFKPFRLVLPNGREIDVPHPEFISVSPSGISASVWHKDGGGEWVDLRLVVSTKESGKNGRARRAGRGIDTRHVARMVGAWIPPKSENSRKRVHSRRSS